MSTRHAGDRSRGGAGDRRTLPEGIEALIQEVLEASGLELPARAEIEADLRAHFEDGLDAGVDWRELRDRFGDPREAGHRMAQARRGARRAHVGTGGRWWMSTAEWWTEIRRSARRLVRAPGFASIVVATLALGVGANTAVFSVVDAVLLHPLPYPHPDRLVRVYTSPRDDPADVNYLRAPGVTAYRTWKTVFASFGALYSYHQTGADLTESGHTDRLTVVRVTPGYFETLGIRPELGRTFREDESAPPGTPESGDRRRPPVAVVILSHGLWMSHFGGARDVVGRSIVLDDRSYQVVGIMPRGFVDPIGARADAWVPQDLRPGGNNNWGNFFLSGVGRLNAGLPLAAAQARVDALYDRILEENPDAQDAWRPRLVPLHADMVGSTRRTMILILAAAAGMVLLTACVNLANLLFARGLGLERDVAVRAALGSGRGRIVAGVLVESGLLVVAGGVAGLLVGWVGVRALLALSPDALPALTRPHLGTALFLFALLATVAALALSGLVPALRISLIPPAEALRSEGRMSTGGRKVRRLRDALAVAQVGAAVVLVSGAALLALSFAALRDVPLAMDPARILTFEVNLPTARYPDGATREAFQHTFHERVTALSEVVHVGAVSWLPLRGRYNVWSVYWDPEDPDVSHLRGASDDAWHNSDIRVISGDYFATLGIRLLRGSRPADVDMDGERVAWVNRRFARQVFGSGEGTGAGLAKGAGKGADEAIGKLVHVGGENRRVVGVVDDVPVDAEGDIARKLYIPHAQFADDRNWTLFQTIKTKGDPVAAELDIRRVLASIDDELVLYHPRPMTDVVRSARAQNRFATALMGAFGLLALLLSLVGTYGVLAGSVAGRTREFGIRMALGADRGAVRRMVLRYATILVVPGVLLGLAAAWIASRWVHTLLFEVKPTDPAVYAGAVALFLVVGLVAGWVPARRATRVDPARTLSAE